MAQRWTSTLTGSVTSGSVACARSRCSRGPCAWRRSRTPPWDARGDASSTSSSLRERVREDPLAHGLLASPPLFVVHAEVLTHSVQIVHDRHPGSRRVATISTRSARGYPPALSLGRAQPDSQAHHEATAEHEGCQLRWRSGIRPDMARGQRVAVHGERPCSRAGVARGPGATPKRSAWISGGSVAARTRFLVQASSSSSAMSETASASTRQGPRPRSRRRAPVPHRARIGCRAASSLADGDGRIVLANQQLERQFGYAARRTDRAARGGPRPRRPPRWPAAAPAGRPAGADRTASDAEDAICSGSAGTAPGSRWKSR